MQVFLTGRVFSTTVHQHINFTVFSGLRWQLYIFPKYRPLYTMSAQISETVFQQLKDVSFQEFREKELFCDVTLIVEGKRFPCHRVILAAQSEYFNMMFSGTYRESTAKEVEINDLNARTITTTMDYIYAQEIVINERNVLELLGAANMLLLSGLKEQCEQACGKMICKENIISVIETAVMYDVEDLEAACVDFFAAKFMELQEEFKELSLESVFRVLSREDLMITSETEVAEAALNWLNSNTVQIDAVEKIISTIRLTECDTYFVQTVLLEHEMIKRSATTVNTLSNYCKHASYGFVMPDVVRVSFPRPCTGLNYEVSCICYPIRF